MSIEIVDDNMKRILQEMVAGKISSKDASTKLSISVGDTWTLVDKLELGRKKLTVKELALLKKIEKRNAIIIERKLISGKKPEKVVVRVIQYRTPYRKGLEYVPVANEKEAMNHEHLEKKSHEEFYLDAA